MKKKYKKKCKKVLIFQVRSQFVFWKNYNALATDKIFFF